MNITEIFEIQKELEDSLSNRIKDRFLEGVIDGYVDVELLDDRLKSGSFTSELFLRVFEFDSNLDLSVFMRLQEIFCMEVGIDEIGKWNESHKAELIKEPRTLTKTLTMTGLIKDAIVSFNVDHYYKTINFSVHYKYSKREEDDRLLIEAAHKAYYQLSVGDRVVPKDGRPLRSGASAYEYAIVESLNPFVLVSEGSDMTWFTLKEENFQAWVPF